MGKAADGLEERHDAGVTEAQCRDPLAGDHGRLLQTVEGVLGEYTVVTDMLDFEVAPIRGDVAFLDSAPRNRTSRKQQAEEWFALAEQLAETDAFGAEQAYRKLLELAPSPHYHAYTNLGVLLCEAETRCDEALSVFDGALEHFPDDALLHFNRAVVPHLHGRKVLLR